MVKRKRHYRQQKRQMEEKLRKTILATVLIPVLIILAFGFFGPQIGGFFGIISTYKGSGGPSDTLAPPAPIFNGAPEAVNTTNIKLEGHSETGSTVRLFVNGPETQSTITTNDGVFTFENVELMKGRNSVFVKAVDQDNNESDKSEVLTIKYDDDRPEIEIISPQNGEAVKNLNKRILVRGKINEKASIRINDKLAVQKPDLSFELLIGVNEGWVKIKISAEDEAGNFTQEEISVNYVKESS